LPPPTWKNPLRFTAICSAPKYRIRKRCPSIAAFLAKNPNGGMHHICYEVADILAARDKLAAAGARVLGEIKTGAHGKPVVFLHPKDFVGTLVELEQA